MEGGLGTSMYMVMEGKSAEKPRNSTTDITVELLNSETLHVKRISFIRTKIGLRLKTTHDLEKSLTEVSQKQHLFIRSRPWTR